MPQNRGHTQIELLSSPKSVLCVCSAQHSKKKSDEHSQFTNLQSQIIANERAQHPTQTYFDFQAAFDCQTHEVCVGEFKSVHAASKETLVLTENEKGVCVKNTRPICSDMELAHHNRSRTKHEERRKECFRSLHENLPDGSSMVSIVGVCYG